MPLVLALLAFGLLLAASGIKGKSFLEIIQGDFGDPLDAAGGAIESLIGQLDSQAGDNPKTTGGTGTFKGPNAALLEELRQIGEKKYHLRTNQTCRPQNASYGAVNSMHKSCRAADMGGSAKNMMAFALYLKARKDAGAPIAEIFYDPAGMAAPGFKHNDHVHFGA